MVGLGETTAEVIGVLTDLRRVGVSLVALGQYLRPTPGQLPVARFYEPDAFDGLAAAARDLGFAAVVAGPFVRSSYDAAALYRAAAGTA